MWVLRIFTTEISTAPTRTSISWATVTFASAVILLKRLFLVGIEYFVGVSFFQTFPPQTGLVCILDYISEAKMAPAATTEMAAAVVVAKAQPKEAAEMEPTPLEAISHGEVLPGT